MRSQKDTPYKDFSSFEEFFEQAETKVGYWEEIAKLEFTREVLDVMKKDNVSKSELASRLDVQPGMVTRLLSGHNNFELATMVRISLALNCHFCTHIRPIGANTLWFDVLDNEQHRAVEPWNPQNFRGVKPSSATVKCTNYAPIGLAA